jgi:hypothetical protein
MIACSQQEAVHYQREIRKCRRSPAYFLDTYAQIYDATSRDWLDFQLWPAQLRTIQTVAEHRLVVILKARPARSNLAGLGSRAAVALLGRVRRAAVDRQERWRRPGLFRNALTAQMELQEWHHDRVQPSAGQALPQGNPQVP